MSVFQYDFDGADTAVGAGIPAPAGLPPLVAYSGSWRRVGNRAFSDTAHTSRPMLGLDPAGAGGFDLRANVSAFGGDALYARWVDTANWLCARVRRYQQTVSSGYFVTEYRHFARYQCPHGFQPTFDSGYQSNPNDTTPATVPITHTGVSGSHAASKTSVTTDTRQTFVDTSSTQTFYEVILEKSVSGVITTLGTVATNSGLTRLRLTGLGSALALYLNDSATVSLSRTDSAHLTATKMGVGLGPSELTGTALDNLYLDNLNSPPNAASISLPASVDRTQPLIVNVGFNDPDAGDSPSVSFLRHRHPATSLVWTVLSRTGSNTNVTIPADALPAGQNEAQGASRDAQGLPVGDANLTWSPSVFTTAGTPPAGLAFTSPAPGATIPTSAFQYVLTLGGATVTSLEWRVVGDLSGAPDPGNVIDPGGIITGPATTFLAQGLPDGQVVHAQARGYDGALAGPWVTTSNLVLFIPPAVAELAITTSSRPPIINLQVLNPVPAGGQPAVVEHLIWVRIAGRPASAQPRQRVGPGGLWAWRQFAPGINYEFLVQSFGANGTVSSSGWIALPLVTTSGYQATYTATY